MTPDTIPQKRSPEELEAAAKVMEDRGDYICARESRELADERRKQREGEQKCLQNSQKTQ